MNPDIKADSQTIEKVAKAIAISFGFDPNALSGKPLGGADWEPCMVWEHYYDVAKAAIEAVMDED